MLQLLLSICDLFFIDTTVSGIKKAANMKLIMFLTFFCLLVLAAHFSAALEAAVSCYHCDSHAGMACGLTADWRLSDLEKRVKPCPDGFCYTYESSEVFAGKQFNVKRGCGRLPCDDLPYKGNVSALCDEDKEGNRKDKNLPSGPPFNQLYTFTAEALTQTGRLQYCDTDRCNKEPTHFALETELAHEEPPYYCITCKGPVNGSCGLLGAGEGSIPSDAYRCHPGHCFTYVWAEDDGTMPTVWRGCGPVACKDIPGALGSVRLCDSADKLEQVDTSNGASYTKVRSFSAPGPNGNVRAGTVQYCKTGTKCNRQSVRNFRLKRFYPGQSPTVQQVVDNLQQAPKNVRVSPPTNERVAQVFRNMDANGDGKLDETEFKNGQHLL
ncbi:uncharacterized protein LOC129583044 [Paramacrobiotus metropolitanus]|uniref:uncharacterized protein LOC129583044 n=1 Tax=Paramacrobiotus metropolitanus TaxID=2943436 RepID=UPI002445FF85|nr:uncharacterized protein LOC129583044 [Paramacrobiotus metropolitanus]